LQRHRDGSAVHSVMVGGRWAVRERKLQNLRLAQLREDAGAATRRLLPVVQCFCPALMREPYRVNRFGGDGAA